MLQLKIFRGTLATIEREFNAWIASLPPTTQLQGVGNCVTLPGDSGASIEEREFMKEVMYVPQVRSNSKIEVPSIVPPRNLVH